jgi:DNA-directed RNA polymerase sigma subunit (sigma70/sigma32)
MKDFQATDSMRNKAIKSLRNKGKTLEYIANKYGITRERVRQIIDSENKKQPVDKSST